MESNPKPYGPGPKKYNALARISTTHLYAPIRTSAHLYALYALCAGHLGAFLNPGLAGFFFSLKIQHESEISISAVSRNTGTALHVETTSAFRPWQHCTWEFLNIERRRSRSHQDHKNIEHREKVTMTQASRVSRLVTSSERRTR